MAVHEGSDMLLDEIATLMVQLHHTCSTLQGAAVLQSVRGLRQARFSGRASQAFQTFQVAFLQMLQVLRAESEVVAVTQRKRQPHSLAAWRACRRACSRHRRRSDSPSRWYIPECGRTAFRAGEKSPQTEGPTLCPDSTENRYI
jgi:hypothetical protein